MKSKSFNKLRSAVVAGIAGAGALVGVGVASSARAGTLSTPSASVKLTTDSSGVIGWGKWSSSNTTASGLGNVTWAFNPAVTTTWSSQTQFAISDGFFSTSNTYLSDMFDAAFQVAVNGTGFANPDGTVDLTNDVLTTDTVDIGGVDTTIQFMFVNNWMRALYTFTNTTAATIPVTAAIGGNLGSDSSTTIQGTANGDLVVDATDAWYVSNDNTTTTAGSNDPNGDPNFVFCRFGAKGEVKPVSTSIPGTSDGMGYTDNFVETFDFDLAPGETKSVMLLTAMVNITADALTAAEEVCGSEKAAKSNGAFDGLTSAEKSSIVNFKYPKSSSSGSIDFSMLSFIALLAMGGLGIRRKK